MCACFRQGNLSLADSYLRYALETIERYADNRARIEDLFVARKAVGRVKEVQDFTPHWPLRALETACADEVDAALAGETFRDVAVSRAWREPGGEVPYVRPPTFERAQREAEGSQAQLLPEIHGNPFRPYASPPCWPSPVLDLAQALYDGHDNRLILADALEESGHEELARHFRQEEWHPKGCWVMDAILGQG
jgi:hypothetical protein